MQSQKIADIIEGLEHDDYIRVALKHNEDAVQFVLMIGNISQVWDDLIDGEEISNEKLNAMMWDALVVLPTNAFYCENFAVLHPLLRGYINDWLDANELQRGGDHEQNLAFVLRDNLIGIIAQCALIIGGYDWMREISPWSRRILLKEPVEKFKEGLDNES